MCGEVSDREKGEANIVLFFILCKCLFLTICCLQLKDIFGIRESLKGMQFEINKNKK